MNKTVLQRIFQYIGLFLFFLITLLWLVPFAWIFLSSFKTHPETVQLPVSFLPRSFTYFGNFTELLGKMDFVNYYKNNIIVTLGILIPQVFLSSMAAYGFARMEFRFKNGIFLSMFIALMVPLQMILMPRYTMMVAFGWIDSYLGVIIPCIPSVTAASVIRQQIMGQGLALRHSLGEPGCPGCKFPDGLVYRHQLGAFHNPLAVDKLRVLPHYGDFPGEPPL